jgi:hypothetical protein
VRWAYWLRPTERAIRRFNELRLVQRSFHLHVAANPSHRLRRLDDNGALGRRTAVVDTRCGGRREEGYLDGRGVGYFSSSDFLTFRGYWPWTQDEYFDLIEFDSEGMISHIRPCPHSLSPKQLDELRALAQAALGAATTNAERRMVNRVVERLAGTNGAALASGQGGCTDLPPDWYFGAHPRQNPWTPR